MSLFKSKVEPTLHELHQEADKLGAEALNIFHSVAADLRDAAEQHRHVADEADNQASALSHLAFEAGRAADEKLRQADAIEKLVA